MSRTHLTMTFVIAHPDRTSAIIGLRTMDHFDDLLADAEIILSDEIACGQARQARRGKQSATGAEPASVISG